MNSRHLQFCLNYLQTHDPGVAYKMTYPKASTKSLYAAASRLMARPDVSAWIHETEQRVHERALREIEKEQGSVLKEQLLTINQKRAVLTKIITGETKRVRHIKTKYSYEKVEDDLPIYAVLRAIDMDTRLENFYKLLSDPATWRRAQTVYVNTPTLQQQVNVLISQTTEKGNETIQEMAAPAKDNSPFVGENPQIKTFPLGRGAGVGTLAPDKTQSIHLRDEVSASSGTQEETLIEQSPAVEDTRQTLDQGETLTPQKSPFEGGGATSEGGCLPAPDKTPPLPIVNLNEKNADHLTLLNNKERKRQPGNTRVSLNNRTP